MGFEMQKYLDHSSRSSLCPYTKGVAALSSGSSYPEGQTFNHIVAFVCL